MKSFTRLSLCLVLAASALLSAGCPKKPLRPNPSQTMIGGSGPDTLSTTSVEPINQETRGAENALRGHRGVLPNVYFAFDSAAIASAERPKLTQAVDYLKANPSAKLLLEGRCDWRGTEEYNLGLGDRRANAVRQYLGTLGIPKARLETVSVGDHFAKEGGSESEMKEDRRVEIAILE